MPKQNNSSVYFNAYINAIYESGSKLLPLLRARMPENVNFCFLRFLGFPLHLGAFRANPGTTRLPAPALASTSTSSTGCKWGREKNPAVR